MLTSIVAQFWSLWGAAELLTRQDENRQAASCLQACSQGSTSQPEAVPGSWLVSLQPRPG